MKLFKNKLTMCAFVIGSVGGVADAAQITVFETSPNDEAGDFGADFGVNRELGRAWIDVVFTINSPGSEPSAQGVSPKAMEGLYYDRALKQVLYRSGKEQIVCAEDATFLWATHLKTTGLCQLSLLSEKRKTDDGFNIREQIVTKVLFDAQISKVSAGAPPHRLLTR